MNEQVLALFARYGSPALFAIVAVAAAGLPLPVTLLLIITGSFVAQGTMNIGAAIVIAAAGSVLGDQAGYAVGRWGSKALVARYKSLLGRAEKLRQLEARATKWGSAGIFFSRWLVSPLGPWINFASGAGEFPWLRFTIWDVVGETFGAALYIELGRIFSDRVQEVGSVLGDVTWAIVGILAAVFIGWKLFFSRAAEEVKVVV
jgi:membrane protein DedA with SNARE-associated domain